MASFFKHEAGSDDLLILIVHLGMSEFSAGIEVDEGNLDVFFLVQVLALGHINDHIARIDISKQRITDN